MGLSWPHLSGEVPLVSKRSRRKRAQARKEADQRQVWPLLVGVAVIIALFAWLASGAASGTRGPDPEMIARGGEIYAANCAACHGASAAGQDPIRPGGGYSEEGMPLAPALNGLGHTWHHSPQHLFMVIKDGSPLEGSPMTAWKGRLTDGEIRAVMAWFRSLWSAEIEAKYSRSNG